MNTPIEYLIVLLLLIIALIGSLHTSRELKKYKDREWDGSRDEWDITGHIGPYPSFGFCVATAVSVATHTWIAGSDTQNNRWIINLNVRRRRF